MRKKDRCQFRQVRRMRSQSLIGGLGGIGPRAGVNSDELSAVLRENKIVFCELKSRKNINPAWYHLGDAPRAKRVPHCHIFRERSGQYNRFVKVRIAAAP